MYSELVSRKKKPAGKKSKIQMSEAISQKVLGRF